MAVAMLRCNQQQSDIAAQPCLLEGCPALESKDDDYGGTALYWTCVKGDLGTTRKLLEMGARVNAPNCYGHTPLHAAADMGFLRITKLLLKFGADTNALNDNGQTALHLAAYRGYHEIIECLIEGGADYNVRNCRNQTPLQLSLAGKHNNVAALLYHVSGSAPCTAHTTLAKYQPANYRGSIEEKKASRQPIEHDESNWES